MKVSLPFYLFLLLLLLSVNAHANNGCNIGDAIFPNATGHKNPTGDPTYYSTNPITIRTWEGDPRCGIRDNKIFYRTNGDDNCEVLGVRWGVVFIYYPSDNNCVPLPIDDYIPILIVVGALTGGYFIRKKFLGSNNNV